MHSQNSMLLWNQELKLSPDCVGESALRRFTKIEFVIEFILSLLAIARVFFLTTSWRKNHFSGNHPLGASAWTGQGNAKRPPNKPAGGNDRLAVNC